MEALFPRCGDEYEEQLPRLHKVVLEIVRCSLKDELLLGGVDINELSPSGMTALALSVQRQSRTSTSLLLKAGADPNKWAAPGWSPLICAAKLSDPISIRMLLAAGADARRVNPTRNTPLHFVAYSAQPPQEAAYDRQEYEATRMLVNAGVDVDAKNDWQIAPLGLAAQHDRYAAVTALLDSGAQINNRVDSIGNSPLMIAVLYESYNSVKIFLDRGADHTVVNDRMKTLLHLASRPKNLKTLSLLLDADLIDIDVNARDRAGVTAMEDALAYEPRPEGFVEMFQTLLFGISNRNDYAKRSRNKADNTGITAEEPKAEEGQALDRLDVPGAWPEPM